MLTFKKSELIPLVAAVPAESQLLLVHDQGVYIMSAQQPLGKRTIVYADGCNPEKDADWWETSRRLVGGDDFGEEFATAGSIVTMLKAARQGIRIIVTETEIRTEPY